MCGIVGHFRFKASVEQIRTVVQKQLKTISYRGPDGDGIFADSTTVLGHVRLSIIDLAQGAQPLSTTDGSLHITFNGEIYNYLELKAELEAKGHSFVTNSDTEVLLIAYKEWGEAVVSKLNGMFAFAIYDKAKQRLFCARDPFGQKPFYYFMHGSTFCFASEVKAFFPIPEFSRSVDPAAVSAYLRFEALYNEQSIFEGVKKLPQGHCLTVSDNTVGNNGVLLQRYHNDIPEERITDFPELLRRTHLTLEDAVRVAFRADVPVGVLLSGGLDSSLVLAALRSALPQSDIAAFHIHMADNPTYDESSYARAVAKHCNSKYLEINFTLKDMSEVANQILPALDEPQADPGLIAKYTVCRALKGLTKVALTGDGADELFYGYISFKAQRIAKYYRHLPTAFHNLVKPLVKLLPTSGGYMQLDFLAKQFTKGFPADEALRNARWTSAFSESEISNVLKNVDNNGSARAIEFLYQLDRNSAGSGHLGKLSYLYQNTFLPDYVLKNSDRVSMLNSIELRAPLLDPRLTALANASSDKLKMPGFKTKHLLKTVALRHLPPELVFRKKIGFTIPAAELIRNELRTEIEDLFSPAFLKQQGIFESEPIQAILGQHFSRKANNYKQIWTLYSLQKWLVGNNLN